jgi:hypothetical protein
VSDEQAGQRPNSWRAGALAVATLAVLTLLFMIAGGHSAVPTAQVPATGGHHGSALSPGTHLVTIDSLRFVDLRYGFALVTTCQQDGEDCVHTLASTADGGVTWQARVPPWGPADDVADGPRMYVFDARHLVLDADQAGHRRWSSADAGATWRPVAEPGSRTVAAAPAGSVIVAEDPEYWGGTGGPLFAMAPDGTGRWLTRQPAGAGDLDGDPVAAPDGSVWLTGGEEGGAHWVAVSRDRGRTWQRRTAPAIATGACTLVTPAGGAYLGCAGDASPAVYRSTDTGRTWRAIAAPADWSTLVTAGGTPLCAGDAGAVYVLGPRGTFGQVAAPPATAVAAVGAYAVLVTGGSPQLRYFLSADGATWREITPGGLDRPGGQPRG